jgi:hypothetical protein
MKVVKIALLYVLAMGLVACQGPTVAPQRSKKAKLPPKKPHLQKIISDQVYEKNRAFGLAKNLKPDEPKERLESLLPAFLGELRRAAKEDMPSAYEAISLLGQQPRAFSAMYEYYNQIPATDYPGRLFVLSIIGEMRKPEALPMLRGLVWSPLPPGKRNVYLSKRQLEAIIKVKAVHGIAYLRTEEAYQELRKIIQTHESPIVRIGAIEAYKWNRGYHEETLAELRRILPEQYHSYVNRRGRYKMVLEGTILQR